MIEKGRTNYFTEEERGLIGQQLEGQVKLEPVLLKKPLITTEPRFLGGGSFGNVFQAFCAKKQIPFAMKKIPKKILDKKSRELVLQEVEILRKLRHPHIVDFYGFEEDNSFYKIYMEFMEEGSVSSIIDNYGLLQESVVVNYLRQIISALEYLHYNNVIHRDIKGGNILVKSNGMVKIGDVGSAKIIKQQNKANSFVGTGCWMAPEIVQCKEYDCYADIWSLGCTVYEMLTGKPPFESENSYGALMKIVEFNEKNFVYPPGLSYLAVSFIRCCLKKNDKERANIFQLKQHPFVHPVSKKEIVSLNSNLSTYLTNLSQKEKEDERKKQVVKQPSTRMVDMAN